MKNPLRIQFASDLHLEFHDKKNTGSISPQMFLKPVGDILALCGDIGYPDRPAFETFLKWCSESFRYVVFLAGNHEFYNFGLSKKLNVQEKLDLCDQIARQFQNVYFLHRRAVQFPEWNLRILGCTLWTEIHPEDDKLFVTYMNDARQILVNGRPASPDLFRSWHEEDRDWLDHEIDQAKSDGVEVVVLTHHLPSYKMINPKYHGNIMNFCFASNQEPLIRSPVRAWLCGHSHTANEVKISGIPCCINPFGYPQEPGTGYSRERVIEITCDSRDESYDSSVKPSV